MIVYVEQTFIENFLVTYFVISIVFLFIKQIKNTVWQIIASMFGGLVSLLYPILNIKGILLVILKLCIGYIITLFAYKTKSQKRQIFFYCMFMFVTAIYGGITLMIHFSLYGNFSDTQKLPTILIVFVFVVVTYFLKQISSRLYQKKQINNFVFRVVIKNNGKQFKTNGYLDTGNVLCGRNGEPISFVNYKLFCLINKNFKVSDFLKDNLTNLKNGRFIKVKTITGTDSIIVFDVDSIEIMENNHVHKVKNPSFALSKVKISQLDCDMILNPKCIKGV